MFQVTDIVVVLFITTIINFVATIVSWQRKRARSGLYFALGMTSLTLWSLAVGLGYASVSMELKVFFAKIDAIGYNFALVLLLFFVMYFAGLDKWADNKWLRALIFFIPVSNILLIWTNELHRWVWRGFRPVQDNVLVFEHGPGFIWVAVTGYVIFPTMIAILWWTSRKGSEISRRQGRLLFYASVFPLLANMFYLYGVGGTEGVDWSSVTFSITGLLILFTLYGHRLLDLVPIAREKLMADLSDGMIVLDMQGRIIDINRAAASMIQSSPEKLTGRTLVDVVPLVGSLPELISEQEIRTELAFGDAVKRYFDVLISALQDEQKKIIGRLIVFRDITERKQAEQASEQRFLEIQQLNKNLHETQAQLVEQQRALATMEERQRLARNLHDSVNQSIHGMVLFTDTLAATLEKNNLERARQIMDRLRESANQSLRETRLMLYELQGSGPERSVDLVRDLKDRLAMVESRVGVRTQLILEGSLESCPPEWYENLFWIAVEALNNSLKHAQARSVQIMIRCSDQRLELEVIDDGKGFDTHKVEAGGLGLKNLRTRADIIGGTLDVESEPLKGTTVRFSAELKAKQNE